jgi:hypothetical protein
VGWRGFSFYVQDLRQSKQTMTINTLLEKLGLLRFKMDFTALQRVTLSRRENVPTAIS